ncbi:MAG: hypothetical protein ABSE95_04815 [Thermodesulfobacteriota bacterium]
MAKKQEGEEDNNIPVCDNTYPHNTYPHEGGPNVWVVQRPVGPITHRP